MFLFLVTLAYKKLNPSAKIKKKAMKCVILLLIISLASLVQLQSCPVSSINEKFFVSGKPRYLTVPAPHPSGDTVCPDFNGKDSCCDSTTLEDIKTKYEAFKAEIQKNMEQQLSNLENGFSGISKVNFNQLTNGTGSERLRLLVEKIVQIAKRKFTKLREAMAQCFTSMYGTQAGFLCAACSTAFPVSAPANGTNGTEPPKVMIHRNTLAKLSQDCKDYSKLLRDAVDEYHRAKAQITDYMTAEIGIDSPDCTCSGNATDEEKPFDITVEGVTPKPPARRLLYGEDTDYAIQSFDQDVQIVRDDSIPNIVNNETYEPEIEADQILRNDTKNIVDKKAHKKKTFSHVKNLIIALYSVISKGMKSRSYNKIPAMLKSFINFENFDFEEGVSIATQFASSVKSWAENWPFMRKLLFKVSLDMVLNMPWSTPTPSKIKELKEKKAKDQKPGKLLADDPQQPPNKNGTGSNNPNRPQHNNTGPQQPPKPNNQDQKPQPPAQRDFAIQYNMPQLAKSYADQLAAVLAALADGSITTSVIKFPYIQNDQVLTYEMANETTIDALAQKEAELLKTDGVLLLPIFQIVANVQGMFATLGPKADEFAKNYLAKMSQDDMKYIRDVYFPPRYYRRNPKEKKEQPQAPEFAAQVIAYYQENIEKVVKQTFADCLEIIKKSPALSDMGAQMLSAGKKGQKMDAVRNKRQPSEEEKKIMQTCEVNRRFIEENNQTCTNDTNCFVCYMAKNGTIVQLNLTAGQTVEDINLYIENAKRADKMMGKVDISEMPPYDDAEAIQTAKCPRMISARTKLCLPINVQQALGLKPLDDPAAINDNNVGKDMLKRSMNKKKFKEATDLVMAQDQAATRLLIEDEGDMSLIESDSGVDLLNMKVGLSVDVPIGETNTDPVTSYSAATYTTFLGLLILGLIMLI